MAPPRSIQGLAFTLAEDLVTALAVLIPYVARVMTMWRGAISREKAVWGVTPILNMHFNARCNTLLGVESDCIVFRTYYIWRDFSINKERHSDWIIQHYPRFYRLWLTCVLYGALLRYDHFHYFLDRGILLPEPRRKYGINKRELELLRRSGKRLFTYTYGADVRTRTETEALGRFHVCQGCSEPGVHCICDSEKARENVDAVRPFATAMLGMGDMLEYVPGALNAFFWPLDLEVIPYVGSRQDFSRPLRVGHGANHPQLKGTHYLVEAIDRLAAEGYAITLVRLQGVPRDQIQAMFSSVDVIADQFIAGFHGYTALEGLAHGKPVLVYLRHTHTQLAPEECPFLNADPETLYETLRTMCESRNRLEQTGWLGREYVEKYYSLEAFAQRLGRIYLDTRTFTGRRARKLERTMGELAARNERRLMAFYSQHARPDATAGAQEAMVSGAPT